MEISSPLSDVGTGLKMPAVKRVIDFVLLRLVEAMAIQGRSLEILNVPDLEPGRLTDFLTSSPARGQKQC